MKKRILLTADSPCDLPEEIIKQYNIKIIPLHVIIGENDFLDKIDITDTEIFNRFRKSGVLPKTSAISVGEYVAFFREWIKADFEILHISLSSGVSSSHQNALIASEILGNTITVIDSKNLSSGMGLIVLKAAQMAQKGLEINKICETLSDIIKHVKISFVIDTMDYLKAGGRCSALAALSASMLKIHPCIAVNTESGTLGVIKKFRGDYQSVVRQYIEDRLKPLDSIDNEIAFITYPQTEEKYYKCADEITKETHFFKNVYHTTASCVISSHCGPNTIGIIYLSK